MHFKVIPELMSAVK